MESVSFYRYIEKDKDGVEKTEDSANKGVDENQLSRHVLYFGEGM
jgi:hypothetical protein